MERLTDHEGATLGWIRENQPATPYAVRIQFERSPASHWSGSAGAVYPMMRRLERRGLIVSEETATGRRRGRLYRLTGEGRKALKGWLEDPLDPDNTFTVDPLRTRMMYLEVLNPAERQQWLKRAEQALRAELELVAAYEAESDSEFRALAHDNARQLIRARLRWIESARDKLGF